MAASRAFVALAARSLGPVEGVVTLMQWRALVVISVERQHTLKAVAAALGVHASTATRLVEGLVANGMLTRRDDPADRRYVSLALTRKAERLVEKVNAARQRDIDDVLGRIDVSRRHPIALALQEFADAAGEIQPAIRSQRGTKPPRP